MRLFVLGASGQVGAHLVQQAVAGGHQVTAVVRPGTTYAPPAGVALVQQALDAGALEAMAGHDVVVSCLGMKRRRVANPYSKLIGPADFNSATARLVVQAMKAHGVRRVVAVSAAGVGDSAARMNFVMRFLVATSTVGAAYRDLAVMEQVYAESGLDWLCPRPTRLTNGPKTGQVRVVDAYTMNAAISRADVAGYMLEQATRAAPFDVRTPQITTLV